MSRQYLPYKKEAASLWLSGLMKTTGLREEWIKCIELDPSKHTDEVRAAVWLFAQIAVVGAWPPEHHAQDIEKTQEAAAWLDEHYRATDETIVDWALLRLDINNLVAIAKKHKESTARLADKVPHEASASTIDLVDAPPGGGDENEDGDEEEMKTVSDVIEWLEEQDNGTGMAEVCTLHLHFATKILKDSQPNRSEEPKESSSAIIDSGQPCILANCPPGLFRVGDSLGFRSEYGLEAYVFETGEIWWGGCKTQEERAKQIVQPVVLEADVGPSNDTCTVASTSADDAGPLSKSTQQESPGQAQSAQRNGSKDQQASIPPTPSASSPPPADKEPDIWDKLQDEIGQILGDLADVFVNTDYVSVTEITLTSKSGQYTWPYEKTLEVIRHLQGFEWLGHIRLIIRCKDRIKFDRSDSELFAKVAQCARFELHRAKDPMGISGVGHIADGVQFADGTCVLRWRGKHQTTVTHKSIESVQAIHCQEGTQVRFLDPAIDLARKSLLKL